jgi:4-hydroxybenzoate polyprenyltransferase
MIGWIKQRVPLVTAAVQALLALLIVFGLALTADQTAAIMAFVAAVLGLVTYSQVSPKAAPVEPDPPVEMTLLPPVVPGS